MNKAFPRIFLLWFAFMLDSVLTYFIPFDYLKSSFMFISCMGLMTFTLINNELKDEEYLAYAVLTGTYYSIMYADSLYIYILIYVIIARLGRKYMKYSSYSFIESYLFCFSTIIFQEVVIYIMMILSKVTKLGLVKFLTLRLLPTLIMNSVLFIGVFYGYHYLNKKLQEKLK